LRIRVSDVRRPPVQPLWKDIITFTLVVGLAWEFAWNDDFHGGWFVYACVVSALSLVGLVLRQLGIVPLKGRQRQ
jgi:hypothetical protein